MTWRHDSLVYILTFFVRPLRDVYTEQKSHFMNSALGIPRTFSRALTTFLAKKNIVFVFVTFIKFSYEK